MAIDPFVPTMALRKSHGVIKGLRRQRQGRRAFKKTLGRPAL
jgi:hypothetical protein